MSVILYPKGSNMQLSTHFKAREFDCPCDCKSTLVDKSLVSHLEAFRTLLGSRLAITSGYRCQDHQDELTLKGYETAKNSQHLIGKAADVTDGVTPGHELEDIARKAGFTSVGVGKLFVHVDIRPGYRRWTYTR